MNILVICATNLKTRNNTERKVSYLMFGLFYSLAFFWILLHVQLLKDKSLLYLQYNINVSNNWDRLLLSVKKNDDPLKLDKKKYSYLQGLYNMCLRRPCPTRIIIEGLFLSIVIWHCISIKKKDQLFSFNLCILTIVYNIFSFVAIIWVILGIYHDKKIRSMIKANTNKTITTTQQITVIPEDIKTLLQQSSHYPSSFYHHLCVLLKTKKI